MTADPMNATASVSPAAARMTLPATVMTAEMGSHTLRGRRSDHSTAATAHSRKPNAPTATMTPASGGS